MNSSFAAIQTGIQRRMAGENIWLAPAGASDQAELEPHQLNYEVLESEAAVGRAMLDALQMAAREKEGDGISANPSLGRAADLLVRSGGTVLITEVPEFCGAEHILANRAKT